VISEFTNAADGNKTGSLVMTVPPLRPRLEEANQSFGVQTDRTQAIADALQVAESASEK